METKGRGFSTGQVLDRGKWTAAAYEEIQDLIQRYGNDDLTDHRSGTPYAAPRSCLVLHPKERNYRTMSCREEMKIPACGFLLDDQLTFMGENDPTHFI